MFNDILLYYRSLVYKNTISLPFSLKNQSMIGMLSKWLFTQASENVKKIHLIFVDRRAFIYTPRPRVWSFRAKFKNKSILGNPESYLKIFENMPLSYR